ncbi:2752_t:CDS:1, partial [Paraglomus brasilianum]
KFHVGASHFEYHKTYTMLYEKHIGITQNEVKKFVRKCPTCIRNVSIKEKNDITPTIASAPLERLQMDLVNLLSFAEHNDGYSYILTMTHVTSGLFRSKTKKE